MSTLCRTGDLDLWLWPWNWCALLHYSRSKDIALLYDSPLHCFYEAQINRPGPDDLDLWFFDLKIGSRVRVLGFHRANLGLLHLFVLELDRGTRQTDKWTDRQTTKGNLECPLSYVGGGIVILYTFIWKSISCRYMLVSQVHACSKDTCYKHLALYCIIFDFDFVSVLLGLSFGVYTIGLPFSVHIIAYLLIHCNLLHSINLSGYLAATV